MLDAIRTLDDRVDVLARGQGDRLTLAEAGITRAGERHDDLVGSVRATTERVSTIERDLLALRLTWARVAGLVVGAVVVGGLTGGLAGSLATLLR